MKQPKYYKKRLNRHLNSYIRKNIGIGYSLKSIEKALIVYGYERGFVNNLMRTYKLNSAIAKNIPLLLIIIALASILLLIKPATVGRIVAEKSFNFTDKVGLSANESGAYAWNLENEGQLKSVKINGRIKNSGLVKIYLEHENSTYLIFDSRKLEISGLEKFTALAIKEKEDEKEDKGKENNKTKKEDIKEKKEDINDTEIINETINQTAENETKDNESAINETGQINETMANNTAYNETINQTAENETNESINKSIKISLEYNKGTPYDEDDDGADSITNAIDFSVANTSFSWAYDDSSLCSRWEIFSEDEAKSTIVCYGSEQCCNLVGLSPAREKWDGPLYLSYGQYGASLSNIILAQVLYVSYNLSLDTPFSEIYYSEWKNLTARFYQESVSFEKICIETCILPNLNYTSYKIKFEIYNSSLFLDSISYEILPNKTINHPPILQKNISDISFFNHESYTLNLSDYFYDEENDALAYSFYNNNEIGIRITSQTANLTAPANYTGIEYMFILANDSSSTAQSNIFRVEIKEEKKENKNTSLKSLRQMIQSILK